MYLYNPTRLFLFGLIIFPEKTIEKLIRYSSVVENNFFNVILALDLLAHTFIFSCNLCKLEEQTDGSILFISKV